MNLNLKKIKYFFKNVNSDHQKIAVTFLWVSFFVSIGKLAGAAKEMAIAWRYGVSSTVDAYVFIFNLVNWPISVWFSILTIVLVPLIIDIEHESHEKLLRFRKEVLGFTIILGISLALVAFILLPFLLSSKQVGLTQDVLEEALRIIPGMVILIPLGLIIGLFSIMMLIRGRHRNTLFEALPATTILLFLVLPSSLILNPLLLSTIAGFTLHLIFLFASLKSEGQLAFPSFKFTSPVWKDIVRSVGITAVGQLLMSLTTIIDQFFIAGLGLGALSTVSYANRILGLIIGVGAMAISRSTLPIFSKVSIRNIGEIKKLAIQWAVVMFCVAVLGIVLVWIFSVDIVRIIFERGAFRKEDTEIVGKYLQYSLLQVPFYMGGLVVVTALISMKKYAEIAFVSGINLFIKIILNYFFVNLYGVEGVIFATVIMIAVSAILSGIVLLRSS
ncbi:MAG: hypothetical protein RLY40_863 [Pseudomonadota bacterium]|jgi:peptidoglycan biosynthesis protein MviN/MurJ (putative lipid II flippase)